MKLRLILSVLSAAVAIPSQVTPPRVTGASVEGRVVSSTTGAPLAKAAVSLESGHVKRYQAVSGRDGTFLFEDVGPGDYSIGVERFGYLESDGAEFSLAPGERRKDVEIKLAPHGLISGRVVDEDGDPVPHANVVCYRWVGAGTKKHVSDSNSKEVDEEANFVFAGLNPGHYYVLAEPTSKTAGETLAATYYLNAADATGATPLNLSSGTELRNVEIRLRKVRVVRVRGRIANWGAGPMAMVELKRKGSDVRGTGSQSVRIRNGAFEFAGVEPGSYVIETSPNFANLDMKTGELHTSTAMWFGRRDIEVSERNIDDVMLTLEPARELRGKISMDGLKRSKDLRVRLKSPVFLVRVPEAEPAEDGSFTIGPLPPVEFKVEVVGLPDGAYLKSISYGGQEIAGTVDLSSAGVGALEVVLAPNAGIISGIVRDPKGEPLPHGAVVVWTGDGTFRRAQASADGGFEFKNLAPGDFQIACWEERELSEDVEFRKLFEKPTSKVTLKEGSREQVEVTLITKEMIEAADARE